MQTPTRIVVAEPLGRSLPAPRKEFALPRYSQAENHDAAGDHKKHSAWAPFGPVEIIPGVDDTPPFPAGGETSGSQPAQPAPVRRRQHRRTKKVEHDADVEEEYDNEAEDPGMVIFDGRRRTTPRTEGTTRRLGRSVYDAVQTHGHFGMVDSGESDGDLRRLIVHVPKRSRGYVLDIHPGEVIHANSGRGKAIGGRLDVQYVTRHQYFAPGRAVTSCVIAVPEWQWQKFAPE